MILGVSRQYVAFGRREAQVVRLWKSLGGKPDPGTYQLAKLVDARLPAKDSRAVCHIVCDIDKTYLETEFDSMIRMARIAFEGARDKITVTGASEVLLTVRWGDVTVATAPGGEFPRPLHFVSSSPPQLRAVLEEKMMLDGLDWTSDTFKNQAYNLRMGRMDLLRQHVAYKSLAILNVVATGGPGSKFILIGDNAESDAFIYTGIKLFLDGKLGAEGYRRYLEIAGVEGAVAKDLTAKLPKPVARVQGILIRNVPGHQLVLEPPLTGALQTFDNYFEAALLLLKHGVLAPERLWPLTRSFHNHHGMSRSELAGRLRTAARSLAKDAPAAKAAEDAMRRLFPEPREFETDIGLARSLGVDPESLQKLDETLILRHARLWIQRLAAEKVRS